MREKTIVFFDSDCLMCRGSLKWLHRLDAEDHLLFAPLNGKTAEERGITMDDDSMAVVRNGEVYRASEAARLALGSTGGVAALLAGLIRVVPVGARDWMYRQIAKRRHVLGRPETCGLPEEGMAEKILE